MRITRRGLVCDDAMSCAWIEIGLADRKKFGLASFCRPAYTKVTPRKRRSGRRAHSAIVHARTGAPKGKRRSCGARLVADTGVWGMLYRATAKFLQIRPGLRS